MGDDREWAISIRFSRVEVSTYQLSFWVSWLLLIINWIRRSGCYWRRKENIAFHLGTVEWPWGLIRNLITLSIFIFLLEQSHPRLKMTNGEFYKSFGLFVKALWIGLLCRDERRWRLLFPPDSLLSSLIWHLTANALTSLQSGSDWRVWSLCRVVSWFCFGKRCCSLKTQR